MILFGEGEGEGEGEGGGAKAEAVADNQGASTGTKLTRLKR